MTEFLDHAITVRDVLYVSLGLLVVFVLPFIGWVLYVLHSDRNFGILRPVSKWQDGGPWAID